MPFHPPYAVHPIVPYQRSMVQNLPDRTGKSIEEWEAIVLKRGPSDVKACRGWLKEEFGLGGTTTMIIANWALADGRSDSDPRAYLRRAPLWVDAQYSGPKEHLREIHDAVIRQALRLGKAVRIAPAQTIVPLYRKHVFAQLKASTRKRVDLGLALARVPEANADERLIDTGGSRKGDRITHRIPLEHVDQVGEHTLRWLSRAFEADG